jgi:putative nucleotidyltransferase with HDIG domain
VQTLIDKFVTGMLDDIKSNRLKLPILPEVAIRVRDAVNDADSSAGKVAKIVSSDAALASRLLQVANSPLFRGASKLESVQSAIARLGVPQVRSLVTSLIMKQLYQTKSNILKKRMQRLWEHSTEVAAISHVLARKFTKLKADEAMLGGLLHDIGVLPILVKAEGIPELATNDNALEEVIIKLHASIGRIILEAWKFPAELVAVAAQHEDLQRNSEKVDYVDVVVVANLHSYIGSKHRHAGGNWTNIPAFAKLNLTPEQSIKALEEARDSMAEMKSLLAA